MSNFVECALEEDNYQQKFFLNMETVVSIMKTNEFANGGESSIYIISLTNGTGARCSSIALDEYVQALDAQ